jgi:hypothetical protein
VYAGCWQVTTLATLLLLGGVALVDVFWRRKGGQRSVSRLGQIRSDERPTELVCPGEWDCHFDLGHHRHLDLYRRPGRDRVTTGGTKSRGRDEDESTGRTWSRTRLRGTCFSNIYFDLCSNMPVCVTCTAPVPYLYTVYKTRSNIRLSTCVSHSANSRHRHQGRTEITPSSRCLAWRKYSRDLT